MSPVTAYFFAMYHLGREIDLPRYRGHIQRYYPNAAIVMDQLDRYVRVPVSSGQIVEDQNTVSFSAEIHVLDAGVALIVTRLTGADLPANFLDAPLRYARAHGEVYQPVMDFVSRSFGVESWASVDSLLRSPEGVARVRAETGIEAEPVGLEDHDFSVDENVTILVVGASPAAAGMDSPQDISIRKSREILAQGASRVWIGDLTEPMFRDVIRMMTRELRAWSLTYLSRGWLYCTQRQLSRMAATLPKSNPVVWAQEREDVEKFDLRFHIFANRARSYFASRESLPLEVVDCDVWNDLSRFRANRAALSDALDETRHGIERMTRPYDFREFKLLKAGIEMVEGQIMLLTVVLALVAVAAIILEPVAWWLRVIIVLALVTAVPAAFLLYWRRHRQRAVFRARALLLRSRLEQVKADTNDLQQSVEYMKGATWFAAPEVRETLEREFKELMARAQERQAEYENELKKLQQHRPE